MWDAVLDDPRTPGLPRFVATSSTVTADYIVTISGGGPYCGFEEGGTITLTTNCGFGSRRGGLTEALAHELTEPYGFSAALESGYGQPGFSDHCLNHLENAGDIINGSFCQHELEIIHKAYGYRLTSIQNDSPGFWARHILTGFDLNRSQVIFSATSQTEQIAVLHLAFDNAHPSFDAEIQSPTLVDVQWESDDIEVATVANSGLITAVDEGSTIIRAKISGTLPALFLPSGLLSRYGTEVRVNVDFPDPPPPSGGYRVTEINGPATPLHTARRYWLSAEVNNPPDPLDVKVLWIVKYSNGVLPPDTALLSAASSYGLHVEEGSYDIEVTAWPKSGSQFGMYLIEHFPVCTGSGGGGGGDPGPLRVKHPGSVVPTAVEGC